MNYARPDGALVPNAKWIHPFEKDVSVLPACER